VQISVFDTIKLRVDKSQKISSELCKILTQLQVIEEKYSSALLRLVEKTKIETDPGLLQQLIDALRMNIMASACIHQTAAEKLKEKVVTPFVTENTSRDKQTAVVRILLVRSAPTLRHY
jgi:hypothetical protein